MKNIIIIACFFVPCLLNAQDTFRVNAQVGNAGAPAKAYLLYKDGDRIVTDSAAVTNGRFSFSGTLKEPKLARLIVDHSGAGFASTTSSSDMTMMYLEKGTIVV